MIGTSTAGPFISCASNGIMCMPRAIARRGAACAQRTCRGDDARTMLFIMATGVLNARHASDGVDNGLIHWTSGMAWRMGGGRRRDNDAAGEDTCLHALRDDAAATGIA